MKRRRSRRVWRGICRALICLAGMLLVCFSAAVALTHFGVPWERWLSDRAKGVMEYLELDKNPLPGSVMIVSTGDVRPVEWTGIQQAVISGSDVALMSEPEGSSDILCRMSGGRKVVLLGQNGNWYRLRYSCFTGWVPISHAVPEGKRTETEAADLEAERAAHAAEAAELARIASASDVGRDLDFIASTFTAVGAQAAVIKNGEVAYVHSFGYANRKKEKPMTDDTKIRIASVSKVGVAMAAMVMAEQGIIDLDEDISEYLGFMVRNPSYPGTALTLRMLLTHRSTLTADISLRENYNSFCRKLDMNSSYRSGCKPGENYSWSYSNSGICLAGMVLEAAADVVLVDYIDRYFFAPMGVDASYHASHISDSELIADLYEAGKVSQTVASQLDRPYTKEPGKNFRLYAGDLTISAKDLAKLMCVLADDGTYDGMYYMSPGTVEAMQEQFVPQKNFSQCMTLRYKEDFIRGRDLYYHTGNAYGTLAFAAYDDETRDGIVIITTGAEGGSIKGVYSICYKMADYLFAAMLEPDAGQPEE